jgi:hypothetical protein
VPIGLQPEEIPLFEDLIKFMYTGKFQTPDDKLLDLLLLAEQVTSLLSPLKVPLNVL